MGAAPAVGVLGPLVVCQAGGARPIGGRVQRVLLGRLVVGPDVVSVDELGDAVWGDSAPPSLASTLKAHLSRLRKTVRGVVGYDPISSHPGGYRLTMRPADLDVGCFEAALLRSRGEAPEVAASTLRGALALWRGTVFGDLRYEEFAAGEAARLEELRLVALEAWIEAELELGRHRVLIPELAALTTEEPLRVRFTALLVRALDADGRHREALREYERFRVALADASGLSPPLELQQLRDAVLDGSADAVAPNRGAVRYARTPSGRHVGYVQRGGPPARLLGLGADAHISAAHLDDEPHMAAGERLLASVGGLLRMDRPGVGLSDPPPSGGAPSAEEWAEAAIAVLDHAGVARVTVLGTGWSTPPALALAAARPDRVAAVVVFNGFARFVRAPDHPIGIPAEIVARFRDTVLDTSRETMPPDLDDVLLHAPSLADDERFRAWWRRSGQQSASPATSNAHFALLFDADARHHLSKMALLSVEWVGMTVV